MYNILDNSLPKPIILQDDNFANIGVTENSGYTRKVFELYIQPVRSGPLIINSKRWYYLLVRKPETRGKVLMDDYNIADISRHIVVCFTPDFLPGSTVPFKNKKGDPRRIYAFFDSYLELYDYIERFDENLRAFYEIIFGELHQKPHFDIDISQEDIDQFYPKEHMNDIANVVLDAVIQSCKEVLTEVSVNLDIEKDLLLYTSHSDKKKSYHIVINNKCHNGNKEAEAFYKAIMVKFRVITNNKYSCFVDAKVYSPRQQFRLINCQKQNSGRPKLFRPNFPFRLVQYEHIYTENTDNDQLKERCKFYESLVSFTSGCMILPSFIPITNSNSISLSILPDISDSIVDRCMKLLHITMDKILEGYCPRTFSYKYTKGHIICLNRHRGTYCTMCRKTHDAEQPFMFITNGKVYFDCRRTDQYNPGCPKLFLGYLTMTPDEIQHFMQQEGEIEQIDDEEESFSFGDFDMSQLYSNRVSPKENSKNSGILGVGVVTSTCKIPENLFTLKNAYEFKQNVVLRQQDIEQMSNCLVPEQRMQNIPSKLDEINKDRLEKSYLKSNPGQINFAGSLTTTFGIFSTNK